MLLHMVGYSKKGQSWSWLCSFLLHSSFLALHPMGFVLHTARFPLIIRRFALAGNIRVPTFPFCLIGLTNARAIFFLKPRSIYGVLFSPAYIHDSLLVHGSICTPSQLTTRYVSNVRDRYFFLERHNCEFWFCILCGTSFHLQNRLCVNEPTCAVAKPSVRVSTFWGVPTFFSNVGRLGFYSLCYVFDTLCSFFMVVYPGNKLLCSPLCSFSVVCLLLCSYIWLVMLKWGNCDHGCARSSTYQFACPSFYTRFLLYMARVPLLIRSFALLRVILGSQHSRFACIA